MHLLGGEPTDNDRVKLLGHFVRNDLLEALEHPRVHEVLELLLLLEPLHNLVLIGVLLEPLRNQDRNQCQ
jgi:hypothetical protein